MPGTVRKPSNTETKNTETPDPNIEETPVDNPDTTDTPDEPKEEETNPVQVPDNWEAVPAEDGGGIRPTQVPWAGYENA